MPSILAGIAAGVVLLLLACEPQGVAPGTAEKTTNVAAIVGGEAIEWEAVDTIAARRGISREQALDAAIREKLAVGEARRRGLAEDELEAVRRSAREREERLLRNALFAAVRDQLTLSEDELRAHYEKTKVGYFSRQLRLRVAVRDSREAAEGLDAELGAAGRLDPSSSDEVGPAPVEELPRSVLPAALQLREPGQRMVVETDAGWWLVELTEVMPAVPQPFEEVRDRVETNLRTLRAQEAHEQLIDRLRAEADVRVEKGASGPES